MDRNSFGKDFSISFRKVDSSDMEMLKRFRCENEAISRFIRDESIESKQDVSYVFVDNENERIMCFCAICCKGISVSETDGARKYVTSYPAIEIDYFAVDEAYRSIRVTETSGRYETLSRAFFVYMMKKITEISKDTVGASYICLYSVPQAKHFYERCGFESFVSYMHPDELPFLDGCEPMFYVIDK